MLPIEPVITAQSPRDVIAAWFPSAGELPIRGGWGYTQADACIIDRHDPVVVPGLPFDGVGLEYLFVQKRNYVELIVCRPPGEKFSGIEWDCVTQRLVQDGDRRYDHLVFDVTAFHEPDWEALKAEWEGPDGIRSPTFDRRAHAAKRAGGRCGCSGNSGST